MFTEIEELKNRQYVDMLGTRGWILSAKHIIKTSKCEVSIRFVDGSSLLNTQYTTQEWMNKTKEPPARKLVSPRMEKKNDIQQDNRQL
jgi:hypothetical protein